MSSFVFAPFVAWISRANRTNRMNRVNQKPFALGRRAAPFLAFVNAVLVAFWLALSLLGVQSLGILHGYLHAPASVRAPALDAATPSVKPLAVFEISPRAVSSISEVPTTSATFTTSAIARPLVGVWESLVAHPDAPVGGVVCQLFDAICSQLGLSVFVAVFAVPPPVCALFFIAQPPIFFQCLAAYLARAPPL